METPNIEKIIEKYLSNLSSNTESAYRRNFQIFLKFINREMKDVCSIELSDIRKYLKQLSIKYSSSSTIETKLASIKSVFKNLEKCIDWYKSPFSNLSIAEGNAFSIKRDKRIYQDTIKKNEIPKVLRYLEKKYEETKNLRYYLIHIIFNFLINSGMRISELTGAEKKQVKIINNIIQIKIVGKCRKERFIVIPKSIYKMIEKYNKIIKNETRFLLVQTNGNPLNRLVCWKMIKMIGNKILNKKIKPHTLRHSFATIKLDEEKCDLIKISRYLGHTSIDITGDMYIHTKLESAEIDKDIEYFEIKEKN